MSGVRAHSLYYPSTKSILFPLPVTYFIPCIKMSCLLVSVPTATQCYAEQTHNWSQNPIVKFSEILQAISQQVGSLKSAKGEVLTPQKLANCTNQRSLHRASFQHLPAFFWSDILFVWLSIIFLIVPGI